jgi:hypothetical protein
MPQHAPGRDDDAGPAAGSGPRTIYLIRHGEKPPNPPGPGQPPPAVTPAGAALGVDATGCVNDHSLTPRGWQRSGALAVLFGPAGSQDHTPRVSTPSRVFAPDYGSPTESAQHRPHQTVEPLARRLGLAIETPVAKGAEAELVRRHLLQATDEHVLVCWEHEHLTGMIAALAQSVTIEPKPSPDLHWPDDRFDMVLVLSRDDDREATYRLVQLPQLLLDGDSAEPFTTIS